MPDTVFNINAACAKCGAQDVGIFYCAELETYTCGWHKEPVLHRSCRRCLFKWDEKPLDAKE